ncbi:MAG: transketolase [Candidatus Ancaeobacter aquaticus]|nr:transketolase [Candidatus Ancaeobacter aquaticus]
MSTKKPDIAELTELARQTRRTILEVLHEAGSGHPGGSLSLVEILIGLYHYKLRYDPKNPEFNDRDIFILSKGHCCPVLYTVLAKCGFFPEEELMKFRKLGAMLQGHTHRGVPGVELSTGSLGQGLSVANGWALAAKMDNHARRVYCVIGDGEMNEGQIWEAAMTASFRKLDNVCAILDKNKVQQDGPTEKIKNLDPVADKWKACGWEVIEIAGHKIEEVLNALDKAETIKGKPTIIIADTIKGKGVSFMEGQFTWHGKAPSEEELAAALKELE